MSIRIDPPYWFSGMEDTTLQLMISGLKSSDTPIEVKIPNTSVERVDDVNEGYVILNLEIAKDIKPATYEILINGISYSYEIKQKKKWIQIKDTIGIEDSIYLVMPDRFSRGKDYDSIPKKIRRDPNARHGGNIAGIIEHLDYIAQLGFTALWLTPVLENDMPNEGSKSQYSFYHGYAITDFYSIDRHFGKLNDYIRLVSCAHSKGIKIIKDFVFNHCGSNHPWAVNPPMNDWISYSDNDRHELTNYKISTVFDPYAPDEEKEATIDGWFTPNMPNLNMRNPHLLTYMTQMTLWWIETAGIDAIRMDTYPYVDIDCMIEWQRRIQVEYPGFSVIAETWEPEAAYTAKIQDLVYKAIPHASFIIMDFAFQKRIELMAKEHDAIQIYNHFASDYLYIYPKKALAFLDNHDLNRWFAEIPGAKLLKQALAILLTSPRIPQVLYGSEILMQGDGRDHGDGNNRQDFPGGWSNDELNKFNSKDRTRQENDLVRFLSKLLKWRQNYPDLLAGEMTHYIPVDNVIVYFRETAKQKIMVIINISNKKVSLLTDRFQSELSSYKYGRDILSNRVYAILENLSIPISSNSVLILDLN